MFTVFLSAFRSGRDLADNTLASTELATILIQKGYTPEVCVGFYPENGGQTVTWEQSYAVRVETYAECVKLAELAGNGFQQECVLVVDVLDRMAATYLYPAGDSTVEGYLRRKTEQPEGARTQWRGAWWQIEGEA